jgi:hypothetical protein
MFSFCFFEKEKKRFVLIDRKEGQVKTYDYLSLINDILFCDWRPWDDGHMK